MLGSYLTSSTGAPLVSVILPVRNCQDYVSEALTSVVSQTYRNLEIIVIDDASEDETPNLVSKIAKDDGRIRVVKNDHNMGITRSLNVGLRLAKGEYIARQDGDDVSLRDRCEKQVGLLEKYRNVVMVSGNIELIDKEGNGLGRTNKSADPGMVRWLLNFKNCIGGHSQVMFRRKVGNNQVLYDEAFPFSQDYDLWSRLVRMGDVVIVPDVFAKYRVHGESVTEQRREKQEKCRDRVLHRNLEDLLGYNLGRADVESVYALVGGNYIKVRNVRLLGRIFGDAHDAFFKKNDVACLCNTLRPRVCKYIKGSFLEAARQMYRRGRYREMMEALWEVGKWSSRIALSRGGSGCTCDWGDYNLCVPFTD